MSQAKFLKNYLKEIAVKDLAELEQELKKQKLWLGAKNVEVFKGASKKTHLLREQRRKIAVLETLINQKKYLSEYASKSS